MVDGWAAVNPGDAGGVAWLAALLGAGGGSIIARNPYEWQSARRPGCRVEDLARGSNRNAHGRYQRRLEARGVGIGAITNQSVKNVIVSDAHRSRSSH